MDQDAFRQMLQGSGSTASSSSSSQPRSRFGAAPPKRPTAFTSGAVTDFKPRSATAGGKQKKDKEAFKPKRAPDGSIYRDRAAERRLGKEGDFAEAEKLLEDFKTRSEREEVDTETFQKQLAYLGGDAQHSILVKGLDMALLERKKHEQAKAADKDLDDVEGELDRALEAGPSSAANAEKPAAGGAGGKKKKTRDELIAELKAMRSGGGAGGATGAGGEGEKDSRFKPLGGTDKGKGKEPAAPLGSGWKKVAATPVEGEKKLRKKKKKVVPPAEPAAATTSTASSSSAAPPKPASPPAPSAAAALPPPPPAIAAADDGDDDDDDIFGGAGDYKGLDSESDDDGEKPSTSAPPPPPTTASAPAKRKYFDDDDDDESSAPISTAPSAVTDLAAKQAAADASSSSSSRGGEGAVEGGGEADVPMRLEGLSGGGMSVREMLELDRAAEEEDKRKAKKLKYQAKAAEKREMREANMTQADKDNRDYLEMQAYLAKKEGGGGKGGKGGGGGEE